MFVYVCVAFVCVCVCACACACVQSQDILQEWYIQLCVFVRVHMKSSTGTFNGHSSSGDLIQIDKDLVRQIDKGDCLSKNQPSSHHKLKYFYVQLVAIFNSYHYTMHWTPILDWSAFLRAAFNTV